MVEKDILNACKINKKSKIINKLKLHIHINQVQTIDIQFIYFMAVLLRQNLNCKAEN